MDFINCVYSNGLRLIKREKFQFYANVIFNTSIVLIFNFVLTYLLQYVLFGIYFSYFISMSFVALFCLYHFYKYRDEFLN